MKEHKEWKEIKEPKEYLEPKQVLEPKQIMEPKQVFEGPELPGLYEQYRSQYTELDDRMERLEDVVNKLTPFIKSEERPELKPDKLHRKGKG